MRKLDEIAIKRYGIPSLLLMENAGRGTADLAEKALGKRKKRVLIVCGKGNNGGDGFVSARHLFNRGYQVRVILLCRLDELKNDPKINYTILQRMNVPIQPVLNQAQFRALEQLLKNSDLMIDAIFGIGLERPVTGLFYSVILALNQSKKPILSIDVPSGLNSDNGKIMGIGIKARYTATLACAKKGLNLNEGPKYAGKVTVLDISIPRKCLNS